MLGPLRAIPEGLVVIMLHAHGGGGGGGGARWPLIERSHLFGIAGLLDKNV